MIALPVIFAVMVLVALGFVLPPLLGRGRTPGPPRRQVNRALHRKRLAELQADLADGLLDPEQFESARDDLERQSLQALEAPEAGQPGLGRIRPGWMSVTVAVVLPLTAAGMYGALGGWPQFSRASQSLADRGPAAETRGAPARVHDMVAGLAGRLQQHPEDVRGWRMLGRSYRVLGKFGKASDAYAHAYQLTHGKDPAVTADYAEVLALANHQRFSGRADELLQHALQLNPRQPKALWLAGWAAYQHGSYRTAVAHWQVLANQAPPGSDVAKILERRISAAEALARNASPASAGRTPAASTGKQITVHVALAPGLTPKVAPNDTVFIFARAVHGPPMPVAAVRRQVKDLPLTVVLGDAQALLPSRKLSQQSKVMVGARISVNGTAMPQKGDLEAGYRSAKPGTSNVVRLTVDHVIQ
ncbi:MAG: c-type cytochrome biogenesis protein CcmI [Gammaproteobacteria bacterium]|jgi:cytochrome c-type biogenesis protein CcmH